MEPSALLLILHLNCSVLTLKWEEDATPHLSLSQICSSHKQRTTDLSRRLSSLVDLAICADSGHLYVHLGHHFHLLVGDVANLSENLLLTHANLGFVATLGFAVGAGVSLSTTGGFSLGLTL